MGLGSSCLGRHFMFSDHPTRCSCASQTLMEPSPNESMFRNAVINVDCQTCVGWFLAALNN